MLRLMEVTIFYFVKESSGTLFMFLLIQVIIFAQTVQKVVRYVLFYLHFIECSYSETFPKIR